MYLSIIIGILFIAIACSKSVRDEFMQMINDLKADDETKELIYALVLISLFLFILSVSKIAKSKKFNMKMKEDEDEETKEDFFFVAPDEQGRTIFRNTKNDQQVSFPPREAIYTSDRPINFSFTTVGSGNCDQGGCQAYGIIKGCPGQKTFGSNQFEDKVL